MLRSMPARWIETHGSSLNSFCGWKASFLPSLPKISSIRIAIAEVDAEPDQDLGFGAEPGLGRSLARLARARRSCRSLPLGRVAEEVGEALGGEGDGEEDEDEDGGGEARFALGQRPTSSTAVAISQTRPSVVAATIPIAFWRLPATSSAWARRSASVWMPRWASQAAAATA